MKVVLISDLHMLMSNPVGRLDDTPATCLSKLEYVLKWASTNKAIILQAGDFFDTPRNWFAMIGVLNLLRKYSEVEVYSVFGQHDTYMYSESTRDYTALGTLARANWVHILGSDPVTFDDFHIYGVHFSNKQEMPVSVDSGVFNILVIHASVSGAAAYPGHEYTKALTFLKKHKQFDLILCGDIHQKFYYDTVDKNNITRCILNTGPMLRKEATPHNLKHKPCFWVIDTDPKSHDSFAVYERIIPHQPADKVLSREHIDGELESREMLDEFIESITSEEVEVGIDLVKNIYSFMKKNKVEPPVRDILAELMSQKGD